MEAKESQVPAELEIAEINNFFRTNLFHVGKGELSPEEKHLFNILLTVEHHLLQKRDESHVHEYLRKKNPLLLLELYLLCHCTSKPHLSFVVEWLYQGALAFHQAAGQVHFERGLGFTAGSGKYTGQGHEFVTARRKTYLDRERLYTWIAMLNKFKKLTVEEATEVVFNIHEIETKGGKGYYKGLTYDTLLRGYKTWKGKSLITKKYRELWESNKEGWEEVFKKLERKGMSIPLSKTLRNKR